MRRAACYASIVTTALVGTVVMAATASRHQTRLPDFDGDRVGDVAMWRPPPDLSSTGVFYALTSRNGYNVGSRLEIPLGVLGDVPVVGDYDGDGISDFAVYHPSRTFTWSVLQS